jgi:tRNA modification GTPase
MIDKDTICAIASPSGNGAIAVIRVSGSKTYSIMDNIFFAKHKRKLNNEKANTIHYGEIKENESVLDDVLISVFRAPRSYTGEDTVEISCHGSIFIQQRIIKKLISEGCRLAKPGEFTQRAFLNGKMDLSQAEAVADVIASNSEASHKLAYQQLKGGISNEIAMLRNELLQFASLIELELDFSEEDVEFANRDQLKLLLSKVEKAVGKLLKSFDAGNAIKNGIPVAIVGKPNVGKSTLLNLLLKEDKAIVSEIAGTTRDVIEDIISIEGYTFRFIDTAGIRHTKDTIENLGIQKSLENIEKAQIVLLLFEAVDTVEEITEQISSLNLDKNKHYVAVLNKSDLIDDQQELLEKTKILKNNNIRTIQISAKLNEGIDKLNHSLIELSEVSQVEGLDVVLSNTRHLEALKKTQQAIQDSNTNLDAGLSNDFIAQDLRQAIHYLGEISGEITTDEILGNIFKNFCIGK